MICRLLPPLLLGVIVDCLTGPTIPVMQTMKMEKTYSRALLTFIPIQLSLVYWLGKVAVIEGPAIAYLISRCLWNVIIFVRIYQLRGLVMFPYLHIRQAFNELPPVLRNEKKLQPKQSLWMTSPNTEAAVPPARAA